MTATSAVSANTTHRPPTIDQAWLDRHMEPIIDPERLIIDPHHHLWARETQTYMTAEAAADFGSGHRIAASVFVECWSGYRTSGPEHLRCVGETDFVTRLAGPMQLGRESCDFVAGIVGHADLTSGDRLDEILEAHLEAAKGRFRGVRHAVSFDASGTIPVVRKSAPGLLADPVFQRGVKCLAYHGLTFDAWLYQTQLEELLACARSAPETTIVLNHVGGPLAIGAYANRAAELSATWTRSMIALAQYPNVVVKLGGLGMTTAGHGLHAGVRPPTSEIVAAAYRAQIVAVIDLFGPHRCMFESNFPVDKISGSYVVLWNAFKRIAAGYSTEEKDALFRGTAARVYRLNIAGATS